jgi:hypothetical protein
MDAAAGNNTVTLFDIRDHFAVFFSFFLLGPDKQKIKNNEHQD